MLVGFFKTCWAVLTGRSRSQPGGGDTGSHHRSRSSAGAHLTLLVEEILNKQPCNGVSEPTEPPDLRPFTQRHGKNLSEKHPHVTDNALETPLNAVCPQELHF